MMPRLPVSWCGETPLAYSVVGAHQWRDVNVTADVMVEASGVAFIAAAVTDGGCLNGKGSAGFTFAIDTAGTYKLANDTGLAGVLAVGKLAVKAGQWYRLSLVVSGMQVVGYVDGVQVASATVAAGWKSGWAAIGSSYDYVQYDDFSVTAVSKAATSMDADDAQHVAKHGSVVQE